MLGWLLVGLLSLGGPTDTRTVVAAAVADERTGAPIRDAEVMIVELRRLARTNWLGEAFLDDVPAGRYRVRVRRLGYAPSEVHLQVSRDTASIIFMLEPSANPLDTVRVVATRVNQRLVPFETRRKLGFGKFLTDSQLVVEGDREVSFVLAGRIPGLRRERTTDGREIMTSTRSSCGAPTSGSRATSRGSITTSCFNRSCPVRVLIDDIDISEDVNFLAKTWDLAGVEYYSGATIPPQYRDGRAGCGLLLLWTKP